MKLVTFELTESKHSGPRIGVVVESAAGDSESAPILDLASAFRHSEAQAGRKSDVESVATRYGRDMLGLIERQDVALPAVRELLSLQAAGRLPATFEGAACFCRVRWFDCCRRFRARCRCAMATPSVSTSKQRAAIAGCR